MDKINLNGKRYIALGDFGHLRSNYVRDVLDSYVQDENGEKHLSDFDMGRLSAASDLMHAIMETEIRNAESPDEVRAIHNAIRDEWMRDTFVIVGKDDEGAVYFRMMCDHVPKDDEDEDDPDARTMTPVFTNMKRLAKTYSDHYRATSMCRFLKATTKMELEVKPTWMVMKGARALLDAIFGTDDEPEYHGDGTRAEDEDWEGHDADT